MATAASTSLQPATAQLRKRYIQRTTALRRALVISGIPFQIIHYPVSFDIAWYEQKAVAVLLALLHLGVKGIRLGPTVPAFISPNVLNVLVENFALKPIGDAKTDLEDMLS